jgi:hypothetical protein
MLGCAHFWIAMPSPPDNRPDAGEGTADLPMPHEATQGTREVAHAIAADQEHRPPAHAGPHPPPALNGLPTSVDRAPFSLSLPAVAPRPVGARAGQPVPAAPAGPVSVPVPAAVQAQAQAGDGEARDALAALESASSASLHAAPDSAHAILSAWLSLEVLAPLAYTDPATLVGGDRAAIARVDGEPLPWQRGEQSYKPPFRLFYLVVLGEVSMEMCMTDLLSSFGKDEETRTYQRHRAPIAMAIVDQDGQLAGPDTVSISSFAWGVPAVLRGKAGALARWPDAEKLLREQLHRRLARVDGEGRPLPLDLKTINDSHGWLCATLGLRPDHVLPPSFVARLYRHPKLEGAPDSPPINSFYLDDLARARAMVDTGAAPEALLRYLSVLKPAAVGDLLKDTAGIAELIAPARFPPARWPSRGSHPVVTLQQAAVNAARAEFAGDRQGILAVNGPPGTGKMTLLRDLVAHCVESRAARLAEFDDPNKAFIPTGQKFQVGDGEFLHLHGLDPRIKGFEVLVASSNNKAVENVSRELPSGRSIEPGPRYFAATARALLYGEERNFPADPADHPWGLMAAALGNSRNRRDFRQRFWLHEDFGFSTYLKAARGLDVSRPEPAAEGQPPRMVAPRIVAAERPLSGDAAMQQWKRARKSFIDLKHSVEGILARLEEARTLAPRLTRLRDEVNQLYTRHKTVARSLSTAAAAYALAIEGSSKARAAVVAAERELQALQAARPGVSARVFVSEAFRRWMSEASVREGVHREAVRAEAQAQSELEAAAQRQKSFAEDLGLTNAQLETAQREVESLGAQLREAYARIGDRFVDESFFDRGHEAWNLAVPWLDDQIHQQREKLFVAALDVHKAFVTVAAHKMEHNLGVLMAALQSGTFPDAARRQLLPDLWSSLFLVVPVVSTTFASVHRMLGDLPAASFGWLLVDEAGQATPQAAVGAILRARRAVIVGDTLQIPPVVTIPENLVNQISLQQRVDRSLWCAPQASVQTLADSASTLQARFRTPEGTRTVGLPLLVRRRFQEPMFGVSNAIAYDNRMVPAMGPDSVGDVADILGPSAWFDPDTSSTASAPKWSAEEGQVVMRMLRKLARAGVQNPDIYVICPFRVVAQEMRLLLRAEPQLFELFGVDARKWLDERVGTIHTFQGKEAEAVIAVLGAPMAGEKGARQWAGGVPNILNVMASRAKSRLYVVGSRTAWGSVGHFAELARQVPKRTFG